MTSPPDYDIHKHIRGQMVEVTLQKNKPVPTEAPVCFGVFDSGIGGLTVLKELLWQFPNSSFQYLGDTARLPYGTKSPGTIAQYARQNIDFLISRGVSHLVIACNSASSVLEQLPDFQIPVIGVIEAGTREAARLTRTGRIAVLATRATVTANAYGKEIERYGNANQKRVLVMQHACSLLVSLVEEGWHEGPIVEAVLKQYLKPVIDFQADVVILGCTHFPVLKSAIQKQVGPDVTLVDSAVAIAQMLGGQGPEALQTARQSSERPRRELVLYLTDHSQHFETLAIELLKPFALPPIQLIHLNTSSTP